MRIFAATVIPLRASRETRRPGVIDAIVAWREPIPGLVDRRRRQGYLFVGH